MIAAGSEVGNAATALRIDPGFRIALERGPETGSALCSQQTILSAAAIPSCRSEAIYARPVVEMRHGTGRKIDRLTEGCAGRIIVSQKALYLPFDALALPTTA